jgi:hypothetical protein
MFVVINTTYENWNIDLLRVMHNYMWVMGYNTISIFYTVIKILAYFLLYVIINETCTTLQLVRHTM